jgi:AcrR family transcriptional regulator
MRETPELDDLTIRERIKTTALELFSLRGVEAVSVAQLCREAGIANGTFYTCYRTRDELVGELLSDVSSTLAELLRDANRELDGSVDAHRRDVTIIVEFAVQHERLFEFSFAQRAAGRDIRNPISIFAEQRHREMARHIRSGLYEASLDPRIAAFAEIGLMVEVLSWWIASGKPVSKKRLIDQLTAIRSRITAPK